MTASASFSFRPYIDLLVRHRRRWLLCAGLAAVAVGAYSLWARPTWEASQALVVRDEAGDDITRPGRFASVDAMKTVQETVMELAKSPSVITAVLREVGPPASYRHPERWPTPSDVECLQRDIRITAPQGAEFGRTEVFYVGVRDASRERSLNLVQSLVSHLDAHWRAIRNQRAQSLIEELNHTVELARQDLDGATHKLSAMETAVGDDLGELRLLHESSAGESNLRQTLIAIQNELRQAENAESTANRLRDLLVAASQDPKRLMATPNNLLEAQPAIRQLKDGLVAAQLQAATLSGDLADEHPRIKAALAAQAEIRQRLRDELDNAVAGLQAEGHLHAARAAELRQQAADVSGRMQRLAALRADYANLVAEVQHRSEIVSKSEQELSEARASQAAAQSTSLITSLDRADTGSRPLGPSRAILLVLGLLGGLVAGCGVVLLTTDPIPTATSAEPPPSHHRPEATHAAGTQDVSLSRALARLKPSAN